MLKGRNELHLNVATVTDILTEWLKASWPAEATAMNVSSITFDDMRKVFVFAVEPMPVPAPAPMPPAEPAPVPPA